MIRLLLGIATLWVAMLWGDAWGVTILLVSVMLLVFASAYAMYQIEFHATPKDE